MRNTLALLAAGVLAFAGIGWYLGWYHVKTTPTADGHRTINVDVDTKKIESDVAKEVKQGEQFLKNQNGGSTSVVNPSTATPAKTRFHVNEKGELVDTEGVSTPVPIK
jgi:hypothetical protein